MKKIFSWLGGFALIAFSFYFTDQVTLLVASKSELMEEIKSVSANYTVPAVNAIVDVSSNTIIPGKYGKVVDDNSSYLSMHEFGIFNENYLVYKKIKPDKSLEDNKDKFIIKGNPNTRSMSFIINDNDDVMNYFMNNKIEFSLIARDKNDLKYDVSYINGASVKDDFKLLDKRLDNKMCLKDYSDIDLCKKYGYYLISTNNILNSSNLLLIKKQTSTGVIVLIDKSAKLDDVKILLNDIRFKDLSIIKISDLISEEIN